MPSASAEPYVPATHALSTLRAAAKTCQGCELYKHATQTVFGEGSKSASIMLVGEQPGDQEDLAGRPFVGPAGRLLNEVLEEVGIARRSTYVTNAVKHFKWTPRGKKRLHAKPNSREIIACKPWLEAEIELVRPKLIVLLGATAAQSFLGSTFRITRQRGKIIHRTEGPPLLTTFHPSALLRAPDEETRHRMRGEFAVDLRVAADFCGG